MRRRTTGTEPAVKAQNGNVDAGFSNPRLPTYGVRVSRQRAAMPKLSPSGLAQTRRPQIARDKSSAYRIGVTRHARRFLWALGALHGLPWLSIG